MFIIVNQMIHILLVHGLEQVVLALEVLYQVWEHYLVERCWGIDLDANQAERTMVFVR